MQILAYSWRRNLPNFKFDCFVLRTCPRNLPNGSRHFSWKFPFPESLNQGWYMSSNCNCIVLRACLRMVVHWKCSRYLSTHFYLEMAEGCVVIFSQKLGYTPEPRPLKKGTFDSNTAINSEGSGDMSSTQYNQIWSSANSFFRNRQEFASFWEHWPEMLISVNWQWSIGKKSSLSNNWDY